MKLSKEEKEELKGYIKFENGLIHDKDQLENDLIDFCNGKYVKKYKSDENYHHIRVEKFIDINGEVDRTIPEDNEFIERTSVILFQESTRDRRKRGVKVKNESKTIEPISSHDIGQKRQYEPYYQMNGQKIYLTFESSDNYSEESKTRWEIESVYAQKYSETERVVDNAINSLFDKYYNSNHKNEVLYKLLIHLNDNQLDYFSYESLSFFLQQELKNYRIIPNQQKIIDRILSGQVPDAQQKKILRRALKYTKKK